MVRGGSPPPRVVTRVTPGQGAPPFRSSQRVLNYDNNEHSTTDKLNTATSIYYSNLRYVAQFKAPKLKLNTSTTKQKEGGSNFLGAFILVPSLHHRIKLGFPEVFYKIPQGVC
jgi:hypothetical protein